MAGRTLRGQIVIFYYQNLLSIHFLKYTKRRTPTRCITTPDNLRRIIYKGLVAINAFESDDVFTDKGSVPVKSLRSTKVRDATYNIDLLRIYDGNGIILYPLNQKAGC